MTIPPQPGRRAQAVRQYPEPGRHRRLGGGGRRGLWAALWALLGAGVAALPAAGCDGAPKTLRRPNAACLSADGALWVSDFHHQRLIRVAADGAVETVGEQGLGEGELWQVWRMVCAPDGVYVINERIKSTDDPEITWEVKRFGPGRVTTWPLSADPPIGWAGSMTPKPGGGWLVADEEANALLVTDSDLRVTGRWTQPAGGLPLDKPSFVMAAGGEIWLIEQYGHRIRVLDGDGRQLRAFGTEGVLPGQLRFPRALAVCPGRWVAVADFGNYRVQRFDVEGNFMDGFEPEGSGPDAPAQLMDIVVTEDCAALHLVDSKGNRVLTTTPTGERVRTFDRLGR